MLPGLVNAHSHAFQRVIRGRTEYRTANNKDSFWTWREMMYSAAARLTPEDIYDASRMAFLEMALERNHGRRRVSLPSSRAGRQSPTTIRTCWPKKLCARPTMWACASRCCELPTRARVTKQNRIRSSFASLKRDPETYLKNVEQLGDDRQSSTLAAIRRPSLTVGLLPAMRPGLVSRRTACAPCRSTYLKEIIGFANERQLPVHMHVAEQPAEVSACIEEYGRSPVALLATEGLLSERFTGVHVIHVTPKAVGMLADARAMVCACPTTERNLGDGIVPVDGFFKQGVRVSLGTDSHIEIDLLEDARELEYHLRLQKMERVVLASGGGRRDSSALAARLFDCATVNGAQSIGAPGGTLEPGRPADFFTVDLNDPSIAGASSDDLLSAIVFSLSRTAIRDVVVGGKRIVEDGRHAQQEEIVERFKALQKKLWG